MSQDLNEYRVWREAHTDGRWLGGVDVEAESPLEAAEVGLRMMQPTERVWECVLETADRSIFEVVNGRGAFQCKVTVTRAV